MGRAWFVLVVVGSLCACAEPNAVLEVEMALDPSEIAAALGRPSEEVRFVWVQVGSELFDFETEWALKKEAFELVGGCNAQFSVEAPTPRSDRQVLDELRLKVWFCGGEPPTAVVARDCTDRVEDWQVTLQRPLYPGELTRWRFGGGACGPTTSGSTVETIESDGRHLVVDRCQILGCIEEESTPAEGRDYCDDETRLTHPCD